MIVDPGENLFVVHRRLFDRDHSRFFIGKVEDYQDGIVRVTGYSFARDPNDGNYCRKAERHTKLYAIASGTLLIYTVPANVAIDDVTMQSSETGLCLTDGRLFSLNVSEWIHKTPTEPS